jgi:4-hydroxybenzoate polyprenyltransferase
MGPDLWLARLRIRQWAHFLALPVAGADPRAGALAACFGVARGVAIAGAVLGFGYLLNAVADRRMDAPRKNPFAAGRGLRPAWAAIAGLAAAALAAASTGPGWVLCATATCLASGAAYSVGPRLKRFPALGTLANATNFAPLLWVGLARDVAPTKLPWLTAVFVCLLLQNQLLHEAADCDEDRVGAVRTTVAAFGSTAAAGLAALLGCGAVVTMGAAGHAALGVAASLPCICLFPGALAWRGRDARWMARARVAHRACSLAIGALLFAASA